MPGFDGSGPVGQGPMTGRGLGYCNTSYRGVGYGRGIGFGRGFGRGFGLGFGRGRGFGFGRGMGYWGYGYSQPVPSLEAERAYLEDRAAYLEEELASIKNGLAELQGKKDVDSAKTGE